MKVIMDLRGDIVNLPTNNKKAPLTFQRMFLLLLPMLKMLEEPDKATILRQHIEDLTGLIE